MSSTSHKPKEPSFLNLTRNLWDQLRELALKPSLRLVTSSRKTLRELIREPEAQTSDFFNIFDPNPVRVGCFDLGDLNAVLALMPDQRFAPGAKTRLLNATNGSPVMMLEVLNTLCLYCTAGDVSQEAMDHACDIAFHLLRDKIESLWTDCVPACQDLLRRVKDEGAVKRAGLAKSDVDALVEKGFVVEVDGILERPNSFLLSYLKELPNEVSTLTRLFDAEANYRVHLRGVLERRIAQLPGIDADMRRYLETGAQDFPDHSTVFLSHIRGIVNRAFDLIWQAELAGKVVSPIWIGYWRSNREGGSVEEWERSFPQGRGRLRLLDLMTGTDKSKPFTKHITKCTYVLLNAASAFGDLGQHQEGTYIDTHVAYAGLHICIELAATLLRELSTP